MKRSRFAVILLTSAVCVGCDEASDSTPASAEAVQAPKVIRINPSWKPIRDIADSKCSPIVGYAGSLENDDCKTYFETDREATARAFRLSGARFVRQWNAVMHWQLGAGAHARHVKGTGRGPNAGFEIASFENGTDMKNVFSFYKEYGIKVMLTLENYNVYTNAYTNGEIDMKTYTRMSDKSKSFGRTSDIKYVDKVICDYVRWIVENGFTDVVGGLELGNEPYGMPVNKASEYAERWTVVVNNIKKIWPEAPIGIAIGEYFENDPDIAAIRNRAMSANPLRRSTYFSAGEFNRWSARYIIAMSNCMHNISHIIYHTYGAERPYSATYEGLIRYRRFNKAFPELGNKPMWITEWRDRSDEDNWSHQRFRDTLTKTGYMLMMVAQPDIDCMNLHQFTSLSGAFHAAVKGRKRADGTYTDGTWACHWDGHCSWRTNFDDIHKTYLEPGMMGPAMRLMAESFRRESVVIDFGSEKHGAFSEGCSNAVYACSEYYEDFTERFRKEMQRGKQWNEIAPSGDDCQYIVTVNRKRTYMTFLAVNYKNRTTRFEMRLPDGWQTLPHEYRVYECPERFLDVHEVPGEPAFTRRYGYQTLNHFRRRRVTAGPLVLEIPANSVTAVRIPIAKHHLSWAVCNEMEKARLLDDGVAQFSMYVDNRSKGHSVSSGADYKSLFPVGSLLDRFGPTAAELVALTSLTNDVVVLTEANREEFRSRIKAEPLAGKVYATSTGIAALLSRILIKGPKTAFDKDTVEKGLESGSYGFKMLKEGVYTTESADGTVKVVFIPAKKVVSAYIATFKNAAIREELFEKANAIYGENSVRKGKTGFEDLPANKRK